MLGGTRHHRVQARLQGGGTCPENIGNIGGKYVSAQVECSGDYGRTLFLGVGRRSRGEQQPVDLLSISALEAVDACRHSHADTVFVEVGYRALTW